MQLQPWTDGKGARLRVTNGDTSAGAPEPQRLSIQAAMAHSQMTSVYAIMKKIYASIEKDTFPMTVYELDKRLANHTLTANERLTLKSAMSLSGLLRS
jgi:hypothetical protein